MPPAMANLPPGSRASALPDARELGTLKSVVTLPSPPPKDVSKGTVGVEARGGEVAAVAAAGRAGYQDFAAGQRRDGAGGGAVAVEVEGDDAVAAEAPVHRTVGQQPRDQKSFRSGTVGTSGSVSVAPLPAIRIFPSPCTAAAVASSVDP